MSRKRNRFFKTSPQKSLREKSKARQRTEKAEKKVAREAAKAKKNK